MAMYLDEMTIYLSRFIDSNIDDYFEMMKELRPDRGYGYYYRSDEVTQTFRDIVHNLREEFGDLRIPERFASPQQFLDTLTNFQQMLIRKEKLLSEIYEEINEQKAPIPIPLREAYKMNNSVLCAVDFVLSIKDNSGKSAPSKKKLAFEKVIHLLRRFDRVATQLQRRRKTQGVLRPTLTIKDEYDVQDLLHALLKIEFSDIKAEEWTPSVAGSSTRMDFILRDEKIVIEVKKTRDTLKDAQIGDELIIDIAKYKKHPDCERLICFVYDPDKHLINPNGLINDLSNEDLIPVTVVINPLL